MKNYVVVWECNMFNFHSKLSKDARKQYETNFKNCKGLEDLFNCINEFLFGFMKDGYFPEVLSIKEEGAQR